MMDWKDTVMGEEKLQEICDEFNGTARDVLEEVAKAQAEITGKIMYDEGFKAGRDSRKGEIEELMSMAFRDGERIGTRKVVEWIPELIQKIKDNMWKDDWGVRGVLYEDMLDSLVKKLVKAKLKEWGIE